MATTKRIYKNGLLTMAILLLGLLFCFKTTTAVHAFTTDPTPTEQYVTDDYSHLLDFKTKRMVIQKEKYYKNHAKAHPQVVMMTIPSSNGESIDDYSDSLLGNKRWHFGDKKYNNGVLILFAKNHGQNNVRISTGYGAEGVLPDLKCNNILTKNKALLKSHDKAKINKGLQNVFKEVTAILDTQKAQKSMTDRSNSHFVLWTIIIAVMAIALIIYFIIRFYKHDNDNSGGPLSNDPSDNSHGGGSGFIPGVLLGGALAHSDHDYSNSDSDGLFGDSDGLFNDPGGFSDTGGGGDFGGGGSSI